MNNVPFRILKGISVLLVISWLSSCILRDLDNLESDNWEPEVAIPLVNSYFGVEDVLTEFETGGYLQTDSDGVVTVVYTGELFSFKASDIYIIPDVSVDLSETEKRLNFGDAGMLIQHIELESGKLLVDIVVEATQDITVNLTISNATLNGQPFTQQIAIPYQGASPMTSNNSYDLSGYVIDLSGANGNEFNVLDVNFDAELSQAGTPVDLDQLEVTFSELKYDFIDGFLGQGGLGVRNDEIHVDVFDNFKSGTIVLGGPRFKLELINGFGIPLNATLKDVSASGNQGGAQLTGSVVNSDLQVNFPNRRGQGDQKTDVIIDENNSNINSFLAVSPNKIDFGLGVDANVDLDSNTYNFITKESELTATMDLELPFRGRLDNVLLINEFVADLSELNDVKYAELKMVMENSFPLQVQVQAYFESDGGSVIDSVFQDNDILFRGAPTDENGISTGSVREESLILLEEARLSDIKALATKIRLKVLLVTDDDGQKIVKITDNNFLDIKIGVLAQL